MRRLLSPVERIMLWLIFGFILHSLFLGAMDKRQAQQYASLVEGTIRTTQFGAQLQKHEEALYISWFPLYQRRTEIPLVAPLGSRWQRVGTWMEQYRGWSREARLRSELTARTSLFVYPEKDKRKEPDESARVWASIRELPSNTVGRLAVSTRHPVSPEGLLDMLGPYGVSVEWMPVYEPEGAFDPPIGIATPMETGERKGLTETNLAKQVQTFYEDLARMKLSEKEVTAWFGHDLDLAKRKNRLEKQPLQVYGAIVTGPTNRLARLSELLELHSPYLITIELDSSTLFQPDEAKHAPTL